MLLFFSCSKSPLYNDILNHAEKVTQQFPDSALKILDSIASPDKLSEDLFYKYHLLRIQAKYKSDEDVTSDSIIFKVRD
ncbi:MAG: hypothetical protein LBV43_05105 [Prevotella sp.]|nr:hypothetical protein [Prevotella sp.]